MKKQKLLASAFAASIVRVSSLKKLNKVIIVTACTISLFILFPGAYSAEPTHRDPALPSAPPQPSDEMQILNSEIDTSAPFPVIPIVVATIVITTVFAGLLVYYKKRKSGAEA